MLWRERQQFVMQSDRADCEKPSGVLSFPQFSLVVGKAPTGKKKGRPLLVFWVMEHGVMGKADILSAELW